MGACWARWAAQPSPPPAWTAAAEEILRCVAAGGEQELAMLADAAGQSPAGLKQASSGKNLVWEKTLSSTDLQTIQTSEPVRTPHCQETSGKPNRPPRQSSCAASSTPPPRRTRPACRHRLRSAMRRLAAAGRGNHKREEAAYTLHRWITDGRGGTRVRSASRTPAQSITELWRHCEASIWSGGSNPRRTQRRCRTRLAPLRHARVHDSPHRGTPLMRRNVAARFSTRWCKCSSRPRLPWTRQPREFLALTC